MLEKQREKRPNKMARDIIEYKAEKAKNIKEKLHRDRDRISVNPRKQPPREAAAAAAAAAELQYIEMVHSDSEDLDSDISTDSYGLDDVYGQVGAYCTDTEFHELNSGVEREEFMEKTKKKQKFMRKPRDNALPVLQRFHSTDRHSQECIIEVREPEGTAPSRVGGEGIAPSGVGGGREKVLYLLGLGRGSGEQWFK